MRSLFFALLLSTCSSFAQTWQQLPDFPGTARDDAASFSLNGKIYVGTGMEVGWNLTNDWWCFDTQTDTWSTIAPLPSTPRQYCTAFTIADTGYVFGGIDAGGALSELWAYHPASDSWEQRASLPAEARYACVAAEGWDYGIVATGMLASGTPTNEAWKYHPDTDLWTAVATVPGPSRHRAACMDGNGGMLIAGGADSTFSALSDAWYYPVWFETGSWYAAPALPQARYGADGSGGSVPILTSGASNSTDFHSDTWLFAGSSWTLTTAFAGGERRGGVAAGTSDGVFWEVRFYYGLGLDGASVRHKDWWRLVQPVGIDDVNDDPLGLHPNPGTTSLFLPAGWGTSVEVTISDARGSRVFSAKGWLDASIDARSWESGIYTVIITEQDGTSRHARWIKL